ncbi:MAG: cache domain-containing protein [Spirochaetales bacterium]|nr:cache domain-containing protein [Spirochaetales bacterium]
MVFNSLKTRIIFSILGILIMSLIGTTLFSGYRAKLEIAGVFEDYALDHSDMTRNFVESQYDSIINYRIKMQDRRKTELQNNMEIVFSFLEDIYDRVLDGEIDETAAKTDAVRIIQKIRNNDGVGYFWINNTSRPYPRMIMHPTLPELDGRILDDPEFDCALGKNENLFKAAVDICLENEEGWVDYLWPKPTKGGLTQRQPKLSYVKLFKPWNWVLGTGVYIDDLDDDVQYKIDAVLKELNNTIALHGIGENGYSFIFNEENRMLVHPNKRNTDGNLLINPGTGKSLLNELKKMSSSPEQYMEYFWDKPGFEGQYLARKRTFVTYYEPLRWYISTTFYMEDIEKRIFSLTTKIILISALFLIIALILSLYISRSITRPLNILINSINNTDQNGIPVDMIPETGTNEIIVLSSTMNKMLESIRESRTELTVHKENLELLVKKRTKELNKSLEDLKQAKDHLIQSEKMAALGNLVAGVAHEINTPIGIAVTAASHLEEETIEFNNLFKTDMLTRNNFEDYIETALTGSTMILANMNRAARLIQSFKLVAVDQSSESMRRFNIREYIDEILLSLNPKIRKTNHIITVECDNDIFIYSYPGAFSQILTNLIINSLQHGFKEINDGKILVSILKNAKMIKIIYKDNGMGIPSGNLKRIFEPFFTTRRGDGNAGLGLHIVYNIVTQKLGGEIICRSRDQNGTEFELTLPDNRESEEEPIG